MIAGTDPYIQNTGILRRESVLFMGTELISPPYGSSLYDPFCTDGTSLVIAAQTARKGNPSKTLRLFAETGTKNQSLTVYPNLLLTDHPETPPSL